jgi:type I restriction enzyme S subunit
MPNQNITTLFEGIKVQYSKLGDVGEFVRGKRFVKTDMISEGVPCIHYGQMYTHYGVWADKTKSFVSPELVENKKLRKAEKGDVVIVAAGETIEDIGMGTAWLSDEGVVIHDACFFFKSELDPKYVAYFTRTDSFSNQIRKSVSSGKISAINAKGLSKIEIPIPCPENPKKSLEIQAEIVRILDAFTELTAELTTELTARKKQYNFYRDQLLSFEEGEVEWKTLGGIGRIVTGRTPKSSDKSAWGDEVDFVTPSDIKNGMRSISCPSRRLSAEGAASMPKVQIPSGSLLVTCIGADMGKTVINANDCIPNQQINAIIMTDDSVQIGYLFHVLTAMRDTLRRQGELGGGTMPLINKSDFSKIVIPVHSLEEQAQIVAILDKFDALTNSITEGLPREIELRQKQYEYYRDLLLSFPKPDSEVAA